MKKLEFECKLLSDVILKSTSATEGFVDNLDYIPGAKFLGIAAKTLYNESDVETTLDIFHNGSVQFGDAHITIKGDRTKKVPFAWFFKKGEGLASEVYLSYNLTNEKKKSLSAKGVQLKQARSGFFYDENFINVDANFSIKSAYDYENRKAKDSQMYGYYALPKGSLWVFTVLVDDDKYVKDIVNSLEGKKRIGRSRSAEYGLAEISLRKELVNTVEGNVKPGKVVLYAESNLCFYDEFGQNTLQPSEEQLGFSKGAKIIWEDSQVRSRKYQTWNGKRYNRDADRMIIEKGSVFIIETQEDVKLKDFELGIGAHKNEGFGQVIINPTFLKQDIEMLDFKLKSVVNYTDDCAYSIQKGDKDELLKKIIELQIEEKKRIVSVDKLVNQFKDEYISYFSGITPSQWGQVRNYAKHAANENALNKLLFEQGVGYFMHGQSEINWRRNNRRVILRDFINRIPKESRLEFVEKLTSEMGKYSKSKK